MIHTSFLSFGNPTSFACNLHSNPDHWPVIHPSIQGGFTRNLHKRPRSLRATHPPLKEGGGNSRSTTQPPPGSWLRDTKQAPAARDVHRGFAEPTGGTWKHRSLKVQSLPKAKVILTSSSGEPADTSGFWCECERLMIEKENKHQHFTEISLSLTPSLQHTAAHGRPTSERSREGRTLPT